LRSNRALSIILHPHNLAHTAEVTLETQLPNFKLIDGTLPPHPLRSALAQHLAKLDDRPPFLHDVRVTGGMPLITCTTRGDPYLESHQIDRSFEKTTFHVSRQVKRDNAGIGGMPIYRGVSIDRLDVVATHGIDVVPTDSVIWVADDMEKALEYGGDGSKAVLLLDPKMMERSCRLLPADALASVIAEVEKDYGKDFLTLRNGSRLYSRLPRDYPNRGGSNERAYGWYIPGAPFSALVGVALFLAGSNDAN
jgi:hypothetical protein